MVRPHTTSDASSQLESELLLGMLQLYGEERKIYEEVLALSRHQGEIIKRGGSFQEVKRILMEKKMRLDEVALMERRETYRRAEWEAGKEQWSGNARGRLHRALQDVGTVIEEILQCEEENDLLLIEKTRMI